jgi:hypothetical protein
LNVATKDVRWRARCEAFRTTDQPWQLREVTTEEHKTYIFALLARHDLEIIEDGQPFIFQANQTRYSIRDRPHFLTHDTKVGTTVGCAPVIFHRNTLPGLS